MHRIVFLDAGMIPETPQLPPDSEEDVEVEDVQAEDTENDPLPLREPGEEVEDNTFNETVVSLVTQKLKPSGIIPLIVTPTEQEEDSQKARTDFANASYRQAINKYGEDDVQAVYIAIQYGAADITPGLEKGISYSTYEADDNENSILTANNLGNNILCQIIAPDVKNRGNVPNDFHVLRETEMPSVLIQAGYNAERWESTVKNNQDFMTDIATKVAAGIFNFFEIPPEDQNPIKVYPKVVNGIYIVGVVHITAEQAEIRDRATNMANVIATFEKGQELLLGGAFSTWFEVEYQGKRRYMKQQYATPTFFPDR